MTTSILFFALTCSLIFTLTFLIFAFEAPYTHTSIDKTEGEINVEHVMEPIHYKKAA